MLKASGHRPLLLSHGSPGRGLSSRVCILRRSVCRHVRGCILLILELVAMRYEFLLRQRLPQLALVSLQLNVTNLDAVSWNLICLSNDFVALSQRKG